MNDADYGGDPPCWEHLFEHPADAGGVESSSVPLIADLGAVPSGSTGAIWSLPHGGDLDANLVRLDPETAIGSHINDEVDVLIFVNTGAGELTIEDQVQPLNADHLALIPKGSRRSIAAGPLGITYLSIHRRRGPLGISRRTERNQS